MHLNPTADANGRQLNGSSTGKSRPADGPSAPLHLTLFRPTLSDIPVGATLRRGEMCLEIATPPVFGPAKNERRFFVFPIQLPPEFREETPQNVLLAFEVLRATSPDAREAIAQLTELARTPAARAFARSQAVRAHEHIEDGAGNER